MPDRLSPMDTAFLDVEDARHGMHLSALLTFDGEPPEPDEVRVAIERQLPFLPRFRQRIQRVPCALGRPVWVDAESFVIADHVRTVELEPRPAEDAISSFAARFAEQRLDPRRPLWDIRLVHGLPDGRWGLAVKLHHAMVDGLSIMDVIGRLFSAEPSVQLPDAQPWTPSPAPTSAELVRTTAGETGRGLLRVRRNLAFLGAALTLRAMLGQAPRTALTGGTPSAQRQTSWLQVPLDEVKKLKDQVDGTINDVVLTAICGALREWLLARGDVPRRVFTFVPVSLRPDDERGSLGNQIGLTFPGLPADLGTWQERLGEIQRVTQRPVQVREARNSAAAIALAGLLPAFASRVVNRFIQLHARVFSLTCTNVPGPQQPVYFCGRRMTGLFGSAPLTSEHAMTIAAISYDGTMYFSLTHDPRRLPDGGEVVGHLRDELDRMASGQ